MNSQPTSCLARRQSPEAAPAEAGLPAVTALAIQVGAAMGIAGVAVAWLTLGLPGMPVLFWALLQGMLAAAVARKLGMARWWLLIHLLFGPLAVLAHTLSLPPYLFLGGFLALILVHGATYRTQVPTHLSASAAIRIVSGLLPAAGGFRCLDLGCGFGGVLVRLSRLRPDGRYSGVEGAILPWAVSWLRGRFGGHRVIWGNLWDESLAGHDVVYAYLSPACMPRLWAKAVREMRPGALLISNEFSVPGVAPALSIDVPGRRPTAIHVWRIGDARC